MPSRGERNNNPGNLEASPWTKSQPGYVGSDGRFAKFDTMANGIAAQVKLLTNSYLNKGYNTVNKIINRYGNDPGTADDKSVANYKRYVAAKLGIGVNDPIGPQKAGDLAQAMREFETGNHTPGIMETLKGVWNGDIDVLPGPSLPGFGDVEEVFSWGSVARIVVLVIGVLFIALAIAAFVLKNNDAQQIIQKVIPAAG